MQIDRHGINRSPDNGVITKASFEEVTDMFLKASTFAEFDKMTGVSANIMFGQVAPAGTNSFEVMLDEENLMEYGLEEEDQAEFEQDDLEEDVVQEEINDMYDEKLNEMMVTDDDFDFGYNVENVVEYEIGPMKKETEEKEVVKVINSGPTKKIKIKKNNNK